MLWPVSEHQELPDDVRELGSTLVDAVRPPKVDIALGGRGLGRPVRPRRSRPGSVGLTLDELDEELDEAPIGLGAQNEVPKLDHWTVRAHVYTQEFAAKVSLLAGLFGASGKRVGAGAMQEAKRFSIVTTKEGKQAEFGVAIRLIAATTEWGLDVDASIPNIAAAFQIRAQAGDARIGIDVSGYSGPLGALLPSPRQIDVSTLADYLAAFELIQAQVFGVDGLQFLTPTLINFDDGQPQPNGR
jgi:hypothetical protein